MHKIKVVYLIIISLLFFSCQDELANTVNHEFEINARLGNIDSNGYYHLELGDNWQTLHRISGQVPAVQNEFDLTKVYWESSHYWLLGDTLGYIVHQNWTLNDGGYLYMNNDTSYVTWFLGHEVPTINGVSYATIDGEVNTMFAPVKNMSGDTVLIKANAHFSDGYVSPTQEINIIIN